MKISKLLLLITFVILTITTVATFKIQSSGDLEALSIDGDSINHFWTSDPVMTPKVYTEKSEEFRGVWVATVYNLNMPSHSSEAQYKADFEDLIDRVLAANLNAIIFQTRPNNDAFYDSDYAPYSRWLTGNEGVEPGWDVMQYMVDYSHANGIEFHAWLNPYRVTNTPDDKTTMLSGLHAENWAKLNPDMVVAGNMDSHGRYPYVLNPGEPAVVQYIRDVVTELVTLYDVDGIHFDDYFYPYSGISDDVTTYNTYKESGESIDDWRRENVNDVVRGVKEDIDAHNTTNSKDVRFGISPFGLWGSGIEGYSSTLPGGSNTGPTNLSSYLTQYADSKKWVEEGWVHYISPQVYWTFDHPTAPYADVVDWWAGVVRGTDVDLIIGQAIYKYNSSYSNDITELSEEINYNSKHPEIKGSILYSASYLEAADVTMMITNHWTTMPVNSWPSSNVASPSVSVDGTLDGNVYRTDVTVTLSSPDTIYYKLDSGDWTLYTVPLTFTTNGDRALYMKAIDGSLEESMVSSININVEKINPDVPNISIDGDMVGSMYVLDSKIVITATEDIYVKINHGSVGTWELYTGEITLDDAGGYYIVAKTIDSSGTESAESTLLIEVAGACFTDPVINIIGTEVGGVYQSTTVSVTSTSPTVYYKINDGSWAEYSSILTFDTDGTHTVSFKNDDSCATVVSETLTIDATAPDDPVITINGTLNEGTYQGVTTFILETTDTQATIKYRLNNGVSWSSWFIYTSEVILAYTAEFTLEYTAVDPVGNISDPVSLDISVLVEDSENNIYIVRNNEVLTYYGTTIPIILPEVYTEKAEEVRAVWIATVNNYDIPLHTNESNYRARIIRMLDRLEEYNFNTIFFQVRPLNDAFYDSDYAPFSRFITGIEGRDPGWDIFEFLIEESHKRGIEVHAWLNPYRVSSGTQSKTEQLALLHETNFARMNPDFVIIDNSGRLLLNPGEPQVQAYLKNVIQELMHQYDIDGIHFDDYFYSYDGMTDAQDEATYNLWKEDGQSLDDWRRQNIDFIVRDIYDIVETYNENNDEFIKFGISPFGIWKSNETDGMNVFPNTLESYKDQYADTKKWVEEGWLHYILPQIYWEFDHALVPYADAVDWWVELCTENDVDLIIGHAIYRYIDGGWDDNDELLEQLRYNSQFDIIIGSTFFRYGSMLSQDPELLNSLDRLNDTYWTTYATFPWESDVIKEVIVDPVCSVDQILEDGECVDIPLVCGFNQSEIDGECVDDPIICLDGYQEVNGECLPIEGPTYKKTGCFSEVYLNSLYMFTAAALGGGLFFFLKRKTY